MALSPDELGHYTLHVLQKALQQAGIKRSYFMTRKKDYINIFLTKTKHLTSADVRSLLQSAESVVSANKPVLRDLKKKAEILFKTRVVPYVNGHIQAQFKHWQDNIGRRFSVDGVITTVTNVTLDGPFLCVYVDYQGINYRFYLSYSVDGVSTPTFSTVGCNAQKVLEEKVELMEGELAISASITQGTNNHTLSATPLANLRFKTCGVSLSCMRKAMAAQNRDRLVAQWLCRSLCERQNITRDAVDGIALYF